MPEKFYQEFEGRFLAKESIAERRPAPSTEEESRQFPFTLYDVLIKAFEEEYEGRSFQRGEKFSVADGTNVDGTLIYAGRSGVLVRAKDYVLNESSIDYSLADLKLNKTFGFQIWKRGSR